MPIAANNLGAHRHRPQPHPRQGILLHLRRYVGVGADRACQLADTQLLARGLQAKARLAQRIDPYQQLQAKRGWLGMDAVGPPNGERFAVGQRLGRDCRFQLADTAQQKLRPRG